MPIDFILNKYRLIIERENLALGYVFALSSCGGFPGSSMGPPPLLEDSEPVEDSRDINLVEVGGKSCTHEVAWPKGSGEVTVCAACGGFTAMLPPRKGSIPSQESAAVFCLLTRQQSQRQGSTRLPWTPFSRQL